MQSGHACGDGTWEIVEMCAKMQMKLKPNSSTGFRNKKRKKMKICPVPIIKGYKLCL